MCPTLRLQLLGEFSLSCDDTPLTALNTPRLQSLLTYLVLHRNAAQARSQVAFALWPDLPEERARANLRLQVHQLKHALPHSDRFLAADVQTLQWRSSSDFKLDIDEFEQLAGQAASAPDLQQACECYRGDLLPSCYDDWIVPERERLRDEFIGALDQLIDLLERSHDYISAINYARRLLRHDPLHETTYRCLMRLYALCNDRAGVVRVYQTCVTVLKQELAIEPGAETQQAYEDALKMQASAYSITDSYSPVPDSAKNNLPIQLTSFVGRTREIEQVKQWVTESRLVTLTGAGGVGKTRLALAVAASLYNEFPDGVWWVDLAPLTNPTLLLQTIAVAIGVRESSEQILQNVLIDYVREKNLLLVVDNCEHLIQDVGVLTQVLLQSAANLRLLMTSRESLQILGERTFRVPSLALSQLEADPSQSASDEMVTDALQCESVQLFLDRAATALPTFVLTRKNVYAMTQICQHLDGIPLAIELAAARVPVLSLEQMLTRLGDRFNLLTAGNRAALPRHQTLRALIDWSYDLLSAPERVLLRRLAVFSGGWTLEAAEAVCGFAPLDSKGVLDLLARLIDKSLVMIEHKENALRYRMLETIRQYSLEKLLASGEEGNVYDHHLNWCTKFAEEANEKLESAEQIYWLNCLDADHDNFRAALAWATETVADKGLHLANTLDDFWGWRGYWSEGWDWCTKLLALPAASSPTADRAQLLSKAANRAVLKGDYGQGKVMLEESLTIWGNLGDTRNLARVMDEIGELAVLENDFTAAEHWHQASLALCQAQGDQRGMIRALSDFGDIAFIQGDWKRASDWYQASLVIYRELNDRDKVRLENPFLNLGIVADHQGDWEPAQKFLEEGVWQARELGIPHDLAWSLRYLGDYWHRQGNFAQAQILYQESLNLVQSMQDTSCIADTLSRLAQVAHQLGDNERAIELMEKALPLAEQTSGMLTIASARKVFGTVIAHKDPGRAIALFKSSLALWQQLGPLTVKRDIANTLQELGKAHLLQGKCECAVRFYAMAEGVHQRFSFPMTPWEQAVCDQELSKMRAQLDDATFDAIWAAGSTMTLEEAVAYALSI